MLFASLLPLIGGAVLAGLKLKSRTLRLVLVELVTVMTSVLAAMLIVNGTGTYEIGRFSASLTVVFGLDGAGKVFLALIAFLWPLAALYGSEYMEHEEREDTFFGFYTMTYGVMVLMCCARNIFTLYLCYEMLTLVTLPLVWHKKDAESIRAARVYVRYSIGCAALAFAAMILIAYYHGGAFEIGNLSLASMPKDMMGFAYLLGFFGFGVKATVFPLSRWLPKACAAPTPVTALLHAVAVVNAGVFAVLRLTYFVFDPSVLNGSTAQYIAVAASICTVLYGAVMAVRERHVKRKLAFSTISNLGYMLFGISLMSTAGMTGAMLHMICHSLMKITLFFCIGAVICKTERTQMSQMYGLAGKMPKVFAVFTFAAIALMGIPPLAGFAGKYALITAALENGNMWTWAGAVSLLISSILTAVYTLSVMIPAFTLPGNGELPAEKCDPGWRMLLPLVILCIAILAVGVRPQPILNILGALNGA